MARGFRVKKADGLILTVLLFSCLTLIYQAEDPKMGLLRGTVIDDDFGDP